MSFQRLSGAPALVTTPDRFWRSICRAPSRSFLRTTVAFAAFTVAYFSSDCLAVPPDNDGASYADAVEAKSRLAAEVDVLRAELSVLKSIDRPGGAIILEDFPKDNPQLPQSPQLSDLRLKLIEFLDVNFGPVSQTLIATDGTAASTVEEMRRDLTIARNRLIADRKLLLEARAHRQFIGQLASLINVDNKWMWLGGVIAFGTLFGLILHDRRHALRRLLWVRRARAFAVVSLGIE